MADLTGLYSPQEIRARIGRRAAELRLARCRTQADVAAAAGLSPVTLARFEAGRDVAFGVVVRVAVALGVENEFFSLFPQPPRTTIDDLMRPQPRRRARKRKSA